MNLGIDDGDVTAVTTATEINMNGNKIVRETASGNPFMISTTDPVVIENAVFESVKGGAAIATRTDGANITIKNSAFNNMPIITNSSYPEGIKLLFNNCTFISNPLNKNRAQSFDWVLPLFFYFPEFRARIAIRMHAMPAAEAMLMPSP